MLFEMDATVYVKKETEKTKRRQTKNIIHKWKSDTKSKANKSQLIATRTKETDKNV